MSRLPTPGNDANNWGSLLNDYMQQAHTSTGALVTAATNPYTGTANANLATGSTPGLIQLTGDFGGTAASPTVIGLQGRDIDTTTPTNGFVLTWSDSANKWQPLAPTGSGGASDISFARTLAISSLRL
jgi:hypothetical protein